MNTKVFFRKSLNGTALTKKVIQLDCKATAITIASALGIKVEQIEAYENEATRKNADTILKNGFHQQNIIAKNKRDINNYVMNKGTHHA